MTTEYLINIALTGWAKGLSNKDKYLQCFANEMKKEIKGNGLTVEEFIKLCQVIPVPISKKVKL